MRNRKIVFSFWEKFIHLVAVSNEAFFFQRALVLWAEKKRARFQLYVCKVCEERMNDLVKARKVYLLTETLCISRSHSFFFGFSTPEKQEKIYCFFRTEDMFKGVKRFLVLAQVAELFCDTVESGGYWRMLRIVVNLFANR